MRVAASKPSVRQELHQQVGFPQKDTLGRLSGQLLQGHEVRLQIMLNNFGFYGSEADEVNID